MTTNQAALALGRWPAAGATVTEIAQKHGAENMYGIPTYVNALIPPLKIHRAHEHNDHVLRAAS